MLAVFAFVSQTGAPSGDTTTTDGTSKVALNIENVRFGRWRVCPDLAYNAGVGGSTVNREGKFHDHHTSRADLPVNTMTGDSLRGRASTNVTPNDPAIQQVVELRRYALRPAQRDILIDLFEREMIEPQEDTGMALLGQFTDLDDPDSFVWLRGFSDMDTRRKGLTAFYGGPVWRTHREAANATMLDSDNVLLLEPAGDDARLSLLDHRPGIGAAASDRGGVVAGVHYLESGTQPSARDAFERQGVPLFATTSGSLLAYFLTHPAKNDFPALPVRDENVLVWLVGFTDLDVLRQEWSDIRHVHRLIDEKLETNGPPELLRLAPTRRSLLAGDAQPCAAAARLSRLDASVRSLDDRRPH
jgi:NIPSNAP